MNSVFSPCMSSPAKKASKNPKSQVKKDSKERQGNFKRGFLKRNRLPIVLFCLVFLVFGNGIFNGYALDDEFYTAGNNQLTQKGLRGIPEIFKTRTFFNNDGSGYSYRPIALTSFALEIQLFGEKPKTSHFINVLLYAFTLVLLFGVLRKWFKAQGDWFAFFVCLLFLVHPIHTEVVDNIKCRDELLAFFFSICTIHFLWKQIETGSKWPWVAASVSFLFAIMSKTSVAPFVALIPFSVWYFTDKKWWQAALYVTPLIVAVLIVKFVFLSHLPEMSRTLQGFENPIKEMNAGQLTATSMYVLGRYLYLMFIPYPLIFYYGLNEVPICSWSNPLIILALVVYLALAVWTWFEFRKKSIAGFGMIFFVANIILFSNLFGAAPGLMAERFAYSASLGIVIVAVDLVFRFTKKNSLTFDWKSETYKNIKWGFVIVAALFAVRSIGRNETWQNKETLYRNDVELAPESAKINMLLGSLLSAKAAQLNYTAQQYYSYAQQLAAQGMQRNAAMYQDTARMKRDSAYDLFHEARDYYQQAVNVFPTYYTAWSNLGTAYYFTKEYRLGIPYFRKAIEIKKDYAEAYFNLGMSYEQMSMDKGVVKDSVLLDSAIYFFEEGLRQDAKYVGTAEQLSRVYYQHFGDSATAIQILQQSAEANPKSDIPWNAMGNIYLQCNDTVTAVAKLEKAAELGPDNINRLRNLANYFSMHGDQQKAGYYASLAQQKEAEQKRKMRLLGKDK